MTISELTTVITNSSKRWNDILFAQKNSSTDGIPNLSDLKALYGRRNGENWIPNFTYKAGEIVSIGKDLYVSLIDGNLGNTPNINLDKWLNITTNSLVSGNFFVGAFCNFTISSNQIIIENNYNIDSITNKSNALFNTINYGDLKLQVKLRESSNIDGLDFIVLTNISQIKAGISDSSPNIDYIAKKATDLVAFNKQKLQFMLGGEYVRNRRYSLVIVPSTQASNY